MVHPTAIPENAETDNHCYRCGEPIREEWNYCPECGSNTSGGSWTQ